MNNLYIVGIDPGKNTGIALIKSSEPGLIQLATCTPWETLYFFDKLAGACESTGYSARVYIEDNTKSPAYAAKRIQDKPAAVVFRIGRNVGMVDGLVKMYEDLILFLRDAGMYRINPYMVAPDKSGKCSHEQLEAQFPAAEIPKRTNQHIRDALKIARYGYARTGSIPKVKKVVSYNFWQDLNFNHQLTLNTSNDDNS